MHEADGRLARLRRAPRRPPKPASSSSRFRPISPFLFKEHCLVFVGSSRANVQDEGVVERLRLVKGLGGHVQHFAFPDHDSGVTRQ